MTGIHWTTFPTHSLPHIAWDNPHAAHRAVMALYAPHLPGHPTERRAAADILYRLDTHPTGTTTVLIQSTQQPLLVPTGGATKELPTTAWDLPTDTPIQFRVTINPIARNTNPKTTRIRTADEQAQWLTNHLADALNNLTIHNHTQDTWHINPGRHRTGTAARKLVLATIDATATITNPHAFNQHRIHGIGRAKAYGAGLLTAAAL